MMTFSSVYTDFNQRTVINMESYWMYDKSKTMKRHYNYTKYKYSSIDIVSQKQHVHRIMHN